MPPKFYRLLFVSLGIHGAALGGLWYYSQFLGPNLDALPLAGGGGQGGLLWVETTAGTELGLGVESLPTQAVLQTPVPLPTAPVEAPPAPTTPQPSPSTMKHKTKKPKAPSATASQPKPGATPGLGTGQGGGQGGGTGGGQGQGAGSGSGTQAGNSKVLAEIRARIERAKHYPKMAQQNEIEGQVTVRFGIAEGGQISSVSVATSSGSPLLDDAAVQAVKRGAPYPYYPGLIREKLNFFIKR